MTTWWAWLIVVVVGAWLVIGAIGLTFFLSFWRQMRKETKDDMARLRRSNKWN